MTIHFKRSNTAARVALMALAIPAGAFAQPAFDGIVVFGDSLSDPGNVFALTGQQSKAPFAPIPSAPYAIGGHHFSDGETWVEQLAEALSAPGGAGPALDAAGPFTNYAFGSARARLAGQTDLVGQVGLYLSAAGGVADSEFLYVIWVGTNDVRDALQALPTDPAAAGAIIQSAVRAVANNVYTLADAGAQTMLIANTPNLGLIPAVRALGPDAQAVAYWLSTQYNLALGLALDQLQTQAPSLTISRLDVFSVLNNVVGAPALYGLSNTTEPCLTFGVVEHAVCNAPQDYLFWDAVHPTRAAHGLLAQAALNTL